MTGHLRISSLCQRPCGSSGLHLYLGRHREQDPATDLFVIYLWHVTNTENFIEGGYKPRLQEMGPYAYVRQAYKYDIVSKRAPGMLL